jgi:tetratricopeptide (TPR) repeat protein
MGFKGKQIFQGIWIFGILALAVMASAEDTGVSQPCAMYSGENILTALQSRQEFLLNQSPENSSNPYCELAHINYRLAKLNAEKQNEFLNQCIEYGKKAIQSSQNPGTGYFLKGLCLGKLGEARGLFASLNIIGPFKEDMKAAIKHNPTVDDGGPHRALGRLYYKLPGLMGGNTEKSILHLEQAVRYGPQYWENYFFLAQSYYKDGRYPKAKQALEKAIELNSRNEETPEKKLQRIEFQGLMKDIENQMH